ncbi:MAG: PepSY domain-containing protein [Candidatus Nanoarchaeia archaeon]
MMDVKTIVSKVQSSDVFKKWYDEHQSAYLTHVFFMENPDSYDVGYYLKEEDRMASFGISETVEFKGFSEVFKHPEHVVEELDLSTVNISQDRALETVRKKQEEEYPQAKPFKRVVILQHLNQGQVWNITYVTDNFKTLNMKVDARTGDILEHQMIDIIQKAV